MSDERIITITLMDGSSHARTANEWIDLARRDLLARSENEAPMIDLDAMAWREIKAAAKESPWMPPEYMMNDWVSDLCSFLRAPRSAVRLTSNLKDDILEIRDSARNAIRREETPGNAQLNIGTLRRIEDTAVAALADIDRASPEPDNVGDSDRWQDPRDLIGGETDCAPSSARSSVARTVVSDELMAILQNIARSRRNLKFAITEQETREDLKGDLQMAVARAKQNLDDDIFALIETTSTPQPYTKGDAPSADSHMSGGIQSAVEEKLDKLTRQVRDTCARAERAEGILRLAQAALRQWTDKYAHLQNECGERVSRALDYNLPPADHLRALEAIEEHFKAGPPNTPSAQSANEATATDAARYQFLRSAYSIMPGKPGARPIEWYCGTEADKAIDAAMSASADRAVRRSDGDSQ